MSGESEKEKVTGLTAEFIKEQISVLSNRQIFMVAVFGFVLLLFSNIRSIENDIAKVILLSGFLVHNIIFFIVITRIAREKREYRAILRNIQK